MQAAVFVDWVANDREPDPDASLALLKAVLVQDTPDIYGIVPDLSRFETGLSTLARLLSTPGTDVSQPARYLMSVLEVARRLRARRSLVDRLGADIADKARTFDANTEHADAEETLVHLLADAYLNTLSKMPRRIQVVGVPERLQQPQVAAQIRALLLSGVRFAWLWHQLGGRRWHLVTRRGAICRELKNLLTRN